MITSTPIRLLVGALAIVGALAAAGAIAFARSGASARQEPAAFEARIARWARNLLIPSPARDTVNPLLVTTPLLGRAKDHYAEHCALCHGDDGRGDTEIGRGLYPRVPDLTLAATQGLSDGELFWIIENGIRLTGMPAFGNEGPGDDEHAWSLVHWIRRLPGFTSLEIDAMKKEGGAPPKAHEHHGHTHE